MNDNATPLISVIIPTYNHARYLRRALQSVTDQTYTNLEAIVIDNNSKDNTDEVMASFADPRITYLKIHNNGVIAASRNVGIQEAKGEWIAFLDSDDWWAADKLRVCYESINDKVDLIYHDLEIVREPPALIRKNAIKSWQVKKPVLINLLLKGNAIANSSVMVRKSKLKQIGGINMSVEMIAAEDYNTWMRIAQITDQFVYLPRRLGYYLIHNQSTSQKDMSIPARVATAEFIHLLDDKQKNKLEANLRYTRGRFNYLAGNNAKAKEDLWITMWNGNLRIRIKALVMLVNMIKTSRRMH
jgi:glycosyltransferase involved in cell wall biosynthesis